MTYDGSIRMAQRACMHLGHQPGIAICSCAVNVKTWFGCGATCSAATWRSTSPIRTSAKWLLMFLGMTAIYLHIYMKMQHTAHREAISDFLDISPHLTHSTLSRNSTAHRLPRIMMWTKYFGSWYGIVNDNTVPEDITRNCSATCVVTNDRRLLAASDAVVFHVRDMNIDNFPSKRFSFQKWVFYLMEAPANTVFQDFSHTNNVFNWTMTFRSDSDVYIPYGRVVPRNTRETLKNDLQALWESKQIAAVWLASNCLTDGRREDFVFDLSQHLQVDVYGACGLDVYPKSEGNRCYEDFERKYFFMLSFENSICTDYVTEKFFRALKYNIIPVVFGGANYSAIAPPNSYIDALAFKSPKQLAEHLVAVSKNYTAYSSYFQWKERQMIVEWDEGFCELCKEMHNTAKIRQRSSYADIGAWWLNSSRCRRWGW